MKRKLIVTESQLQNLIKRVIKEEQELELQPDEQQEVGMSNTDIENHARSYTIPDKIKNNKPLMDKFYKEIVVPIDNYCSSNAQSGTILGFLKSKLREYRRKRREKRQSKQQMQEMIPIIGLVGLAVGFFLLVLLVVRILNGGDTCAKWQKMKSRNFVGYK